MRQLRTLIGAVIITFLLVALMTDWLTVVIAALAATPWWIYLVCAGIVFCGIQAIRMTGEERQADREWAQQEGNVYIRRMEEEKEQRRKQSR